MTNWLKAVLGLTALALLAIPGLIGLVAQPELAALTEQVHLRSSPMVTVVTADTTRGWFRSRSRVAVELQQSAVVDGMRALGITADSDQLLHLEFALDVHHGLFPLTAPGRGRLLPALAMATVDIYAGEGAARRRLPVDITLRRGFDTTHMDANWQFATPSGHVSGALAGTLADGADTDLGARIGRTNGAASLSVPVAVVTALARTLDYGRDDMRFLLHAGYVRRDGDFYRSEVTLRDGLLLVNGAAVPLPF